METLYQFLKENQGLKFKISYWGGGNGGRRDTITAGCSWISGLINLVISIESAIILFMGLLYDNVYLVNGRSWRVLENGAACFSWEKITFFGYKAGEDTFSRASSSVDK